MHILKPWNIYLLLAGRGYGKTYKGSQLVLDLIKEQENLNKDQELTIGLIGETIFDVQTIMVSGISGIIPKLEFDSYKLRAKKLCYKKHTFYFFGGNNYDKLRGYNFHIIWIDELCKFKHVTKLINQVWLCLRLGISKLIITTTPKNLSILNEIMNRDDTVVEMGKSHDNKQYLSDTFFTNIENIKDRNFYEQEIDGKTIYNFNESYIQVYDLYDKINGFFILGIDPAVQCGLTGIILVQYFEDKKIIVEDFSTYDHYDIWIEQLKTKLDSLNYTICVEINQGGNLWKHLLAPLGRKIITIFSHTTKLQRQQFIQHLHKQNVLFHNRKFIELNKELVGEPGDRLDALFFTLENQYRPFRFYLL